MQAKDDMVVRVRNDSKHHIIMGQSIYQENPAGVG